jgi:hypothetical protein
MVRRPIEVSASSIAGGNPIPQHCPVCLEQWPGGDREDL